MVKRKLESTRGKSIEMKTGCGEIYITLIKEKERYKILLKSKNGKSGGCMASQVEGLGRTIGLALKHGAAPDKIISHLKDITCSSPGPEVKSCSDAIAKALQMFLKKEKAK